MCVFLKNLGAASGLHHFGKIQSLHLVTEVGLKKVLETDPRTQQERYKSSEFGRSIERTELGSMIYL